MLMEVFMHINNAMKKYEKKGGKQNEAVNV